MSSFLVSEEKETKQKKKVKELWVRVYIDVLIAFAGRCLPTLVVLAGAQKTKEERMRFEREKEEHKDSVSF